MAFGNISTLYLPIPANAGSSQWGTDVRKLLDAAEASPDGTSITSHGTGGNVTRTEDPYSTSSADGTESDFGYAVTPSDMNSVSGARRFYPAGDYVLQRQVKNTVSPLGKAGCVLTMFAYRVGPAAGRTRTLLGSAASASFTTGNANAFVTVPITLTLSQVILEADETIQFAFELNAPGTAVTGETYILRTGHQASDGLDNKITTPVLGIYYTQTAAVTGVGTVAKGTDTGILVLEPVAVVGVGTTTQDELVNALVSVGVIGVGTIAETLTVQISEAVTGVGTVAGRAGIAFEDIPVGGESVTQIFAVLE